MISMLSERGKDLILLDGFKYRKYYTNQHEQNNKKWRCTVKTCNAKLITNEQGNRFVTVEGIHTHLRDSTVHRQLLSNAVKLQAPLVNSCTPTTKIVQEQLAIVPSEITYVFTEQDVILARRNLAAHKRRCGVVQDEETYGLTIYGDLDLSDSGAPSVDGNDASDGAGPAEGNDEGSSFSRDDFETCDLSDVKVKVEQTDDFCSEPEIKRPRVENYQEDSKLEEALSMLRDLKQSYSASQGPNDRFSLYGQHVASKLRSYSEKTTAIVEHAINNILFEADMGNYDGTHTALPSQDDSAQ